jgi:hypothetical protein
MSGAGRFTALRRILPIALTLAFALAIAAGPVAPVAAAGPAVRCTGHVELFQKMHDSFWYALVRVRNLRPHTATVSGGWRVQVRGRTTSLHRHADLAPGERRRFWVVVQEHHLNNAPTIELLSCT